MRKKILYVHHGKGLGGAPLSLLYLIEGLDKSRYHPVVLFLHDSDAVDLFRSKNIEFVGPINCFDFSHTQIWWFRWYHLRSFFTSVGDTMKTINSIADYWFNLIKPDIVHLNTSSLIAWGKVAHNRNIPVVWHIREPLADGYFGLRKKLIKHCVKTYAHAIVPICNDNAKPWRNDVKTTVVYNAVPASTFNADIFYENFLDDYHLEKSSPKILFVGGLSQEKGTLVIFTIFKKLLEKIPHAQLLVAGYFDHDLQKSVGLKRFSPAQHYKTEVFKVLASIKKSVIFLGPIKHIPQAMAASDVIVFPATIGHFARPIIEAGFMKKPVIASHLAPLDELVLHEKTGFLIDISNHDQWIEKLCLLLNNKELSASLGHNAHAFCTSHFNIHDQMVKIENIYAQMK